jgi:hypothetical protein
MFLFLRGCDWLTVDGFLLRCRLTMDFGHILCTYFTLVYRPWDFTISDRIGDD